MEALRACRQCQVRTYLIPRSIESHVSTSSRSSRTPILAVVQNYLPYSDLAINIVTVFGGVLPMKSVERVVCWIEKVGSERVLVSWFVS